MDKKDNKQVLNDSGLNFEPQPFQTQNVRLTDVLGYIEVVDTIPTNIPLTFYGQFLIYLNGDTIRLYIYDYKNNNWRYSTLT